MVTAEVAGVVELDLLKLKLGVVVEDLPGVDHAVTDLGRRSSVSVVGSGTVRPGQSIATGDDASGEGASKTPALDAATAVLADVEGCDSGNVGTSHRRTAKNSVAAIEVGGEDVTSGSGDVGLQLVVPEKTPAGEGVGTVTGRVVQGNRGFGVVGKVSSNVGSGLDSLDNRDSRIGADQGNLRFGVASTRCSHGGGVVVDQNVLGTKSGQILLLGLESACSSADQGDLARQVRASLRIGLAAVSGVLGVCVESNDGPVGDGAGEVALSWKVADAASIRVAESGFEGDRREDLSVDGGDGDNVLAGGARAAIERTSGSAVAGRDSDYHTFINETGSYLGPSVVRPSVGTADTGGDYINPVVVGSEERFNQSGRIRRGCVGEDLVRMKRRFGGNARPAVAS